MSSLSSIAGSGLQAAQLRLQASAHNVANMSTPRFHRDVVAQETLATGGVRAFVERAAEEEGVALEQEAVEQMSATYAFKANLQALRTNDAVLGSLLDERA